MVANNVLFGRVTGLFAVESFGGDCQHENQSSMIPFKDNKTCPLGTESNPSKYVHFPQ